MLSVPRVHGHKRLDDDATGDAISTVRAIVRVYIKLNFTYCMQLISAKCDKYLFLLDFILY